MFFIFFVKAFTLVQMTHIGTILKDPLEQFPGRWCIHRGDSMIWTFHVPRIGRGQGLCDIDSL